MQQSETICRLNPRRALPQAAKPPDNVQMKQDTSINKAGAAFPIYAKPPSMRAPLRKALRLIAEEGRTQRDAANKVGMDETALGRALRRPPIAAYLESLKALQTLDAAQMMGQAKAMAVRVGVELMHDAKSEAVRARMVEFFAGEGKQALVNVQVNAAAPHGYAYKRPDTQSGAPIEDATVIIEQYPSVDE